MGMMPQDPRMMGAPPMGAPQMGAGPAMPPQPGPMAGPGPGPEQGMPQTPFSNMPREQLEILALEMVDRIEQLEMELDTVQAVEAPPVGGEPVGAETMMF